MTEIFSLKQQGYEDARRVDALLSKLIEARDPYSEQYRAYWLTVCRTIRTTLDSIDPITSTSK